MTLLKILLFVLMGSPFLFSYSSLIEGEEIPAGFMKEYVDTAYQKYYPHEKATLVEKDVFDSLDFPHLIYKIQSGVCDMQFLITFNRSGEIIDNLKIFEGCDHDGGDPTMQSTKYKLNTDENLVKVVTKKDSVKDESLIRPNGFLKSGYSFWDLETEHKITEDEYVVDCKTGDINIK